MPTGIPCYLTFLSNYVANYIRTLYRLKRVLAYYLPVIEGKDNGREAERSCIVITSISTNL